MMTELVIFHLKSMRQRWMNSIGVGHDFIQLLLNSEIRHNETVWRSCCDISEPLRWSSFFMRELCSRACSLFLFLRRFNIFLCSFILFFRVTDGYRTSKLPYRIVLVIQKSRTLLKNRLNFPVVSDLKWSRVPDHSLFTPGEELEMVFFTPFRFYNTPPPPTLPKYLCLPPYLSSNRKQDLKA